MESDERACPKCAETIKRAAVKCRFCNSDIAPMLTEAEKAVTDAKMKAAAQTGAATTKGCLIGCGGLIGVCIILLCIASAVQQFDFMLHPDHKVQYDKEEKERVAKEAKEQALEQASLKANAAKAEAEEKQKAADEKAKQEDAKNRNVEPGTKGYLNPGTFVYASVDVWKEFHKSAYLHDDAGIAEVVDRGEMFMLAVRTPVLVLERKFEDLSLLSQCRMLDKKAHGAKIWVDADSVVRK